MAQQMIQTLCERVDPGAMMAHLGVFARHVKLSGTSEELESFRYLEATLAGYGYRTRLIHHDAYISLPGPARVESPDGALREAVARLRQAAAALRQAAADPSRAAEVNTALMQMGRALVPIDYTSGDRFGHDPALPQSPFPSLDPLRALAALPADSDEAKFAAVGAVRAANRGRFAIEEAVVAALAPTR